MNLHVRTDHRSGGKSVAGTCAAVRQIVLERGRTCTVISRCCCTCLEADVRTTLVLEAQRLKGTKEKGALVRQPLSVLIERERARRLAQLERQ